MSTTLAHEAVREPREFFQNIAYPPLCGSDSKFVSVAFDDQVHLETAVGELCRDAYGLRVAIFEKFSKCQGVRSDIPPWMYMYILLELRLDFESSIQVKIAINTHVRLLLRQRTSPSRDLRVAGGRRIRVRTLASAVNSLATANVPVIKRTPSSKPSRILFVCMGNICRSPSAEAVLREIARREFPQLALEVDSAGTHDYHVGEPPDPRSIEAAMRRGYDLAPLRARRVQRADFVRFDLLLAMDEANLVRLRGIAPPQASERAQLFLDYAGDMSRSDVPDPYYGGKEGFEEVLDLVEEASRRLLQRLASRS